MIETRLENWGRYYRSRMKIEVCGSAEKMYRAQWRQWVPLSDLQAPPAVDWRDAELVEQAWRSMSGTPKLLLKLTYMHRFPSYVVCRKCGVKIWRLGIEIRRSRNIIKEVLDNLDRESTIAGNSRPPPGETRTAQTVRSCE